MYLGARARSRDLEANRIERFRRVLVVSRRRLRSRGTGAVYIRVPGCQERGVGGGEEGGDDAVLQVCVSSACSFPASVRTYIHRKEKHRDGTVVKRHGLYGCRAAGRRELLAGVYTPC